MRRRTCVLRGVQRVLHALAVHVVPKGLHARRKSGRITLMHNESPTQVAGWLQHKLAEPQPIDSIHMVTTIPIRTRGLASPTCSWPWLFRGGSVSIQQSSMWMEL